MAHADVNTLLSIDEWGAFMGIEPYELNQVGMGFPASSMITQNAVCEHVFFQNSWQQDYLGRQEIGDSIQKAEEMLAEELGFWPAPKQFMNEIVQFQRPAERYLNGGGTDKRYLTKTQQLQWCYVQGAGTLTLTDLGAQNVTYSDANSDGVLDTFTVSFATTITNPAQLALYFIPADRDNLPIDQQWRIRPVRVSIAGGVATITGHRSLCVKPDLQSAYGAQTLDVTVNSNFVSQLEAYTLILDTSTTTSDPAQGQAEWEGVMNANIWSTVFIPAGQVEVWPIAVGLRNPDMGQVTIDYLVNGQNTPSQAREPDRAVVNYMAGYPLWPDGRMDRNMGDIVAHLATGILPVDKCGCERSSRIIHWWRSFPQDGLDTRSISPKEVDECPFGQSMGALWAWKRVKHLIKLQGVLV